MLALVNRAGSSGNAPRGAAALAAGRGLPDRFGALRGIFYLEGLSELAVRIVIAIWLFAVVGCAGFGVRRFARPLASNTAKAG